MLAALRKWKIARDERGSKIPASFMQRIANAWHRASVTVRKCLGGTYDRMVFQPYRTAWSHSCIACTLLQTDYVETEADTREFGKGGVIRSSQSEWLGLQALHDELAALGAHLTALLTVAISPKRLSKVHETLKYYSSVHFLAIITSSKWRHTHNILLESLGGSLLDSLPEVCLISKCQRARLMGRSVQYFNDV